MRRLVWLAAAAVALAAAGFALADSIGTKAVKSVGATITATGVSDLRTRVCATPHGTLSLTSAVYTGTATSSEPTLNGPVRLRMQSLINTTSNLGVVNGFLRIDVPGRDTVGQLNAVYANGQINGLAVGTAQTPFSRLFGNVSGSFNPTTGLAGKIGESTAGGGAVELQPGRCSPAQPIVHGRVEAKGIVSAVSATSITVAGVTCVVPPSLAHRVSRLSVGDRAEIRCELDQSQLVLVKVERKG